MLVRLVSVALVRRPLPALLMLASITLGTGVATAFLGSYRQVAVGLQRELRSYGANIQVEPATGVPTLSEADLPRIKTTFWKHNIVGFAPFVSRPVQMTAHGRGATVPLVGTWFAKELEVPGEEPSLQGITVVAPWWEVAGAWPQGPQEAVIGTLLARQMRVMIGDTVTVSSDGRQQAFSIVGVVTAGGAEDGDHLEGQRPEHDTDVAAVHDEDTEHADHCHEPTDDHEHDEDSRAGPGAGGAGRGEGARGGGGRAGGARGGAGARRGGRGRSGEQGRGREARGAGGPLDGPPR